MTAVVQISEKPEGVSFSLWEQVARAKREPGRAKAQDAKREPGRAKAQDAKREPGRAKAQERAGRGSRFTHSLTLTRRSRATLSRRERDTPLHTAKLKSTPHKLLDNSDL